MQNKQSPRHIIRFNQGKMATSRPRVCGRPEAPDSGQTEITNQDHRQPQSQLRLKTCCPYCSNTYKSRRKLEKHILYYHRIKTDDQTHSNNKHNITRPRHSSRRAQPPEYVYTTQLDRPERHPADVPHSLYDLAICGTGLIDNFILDIFESRHRPGWRQRVTTLWFNFFSHGIRQHLRPPSKNDGVLQYLRQIEGSKGAVLAAAKRHYPDDSLPEPKIERTARATMVVTEFLMGSEKQIQGPGKALRKPSRVASQVNAQIARNYEPRAPASSASRAFVKHNSSIAHHPPPQVSTCEISQSSFSDDPGYSCQEDALLGSLHECSSRCSSWAFSESRNNSFPQQDSSSDDWSDRSVSPWDSEDGSSNPPEDGSLFMPSERGSLSPLNFEPGNGFSLGFEHDVGPLPDRSFESGDRLEYQDEYTQGYYYLNESESGQEHQKEETPEYYSPDEYGYEQGAQDEEAQIDHGLDESEYGQEQQDEEAQEDCDPDEDVSDGVDDYYASDADDGCSDDGDYDGYYSD